MEIAKLDNGQVVEIGQHKDLFPNVSFTANGPNDTWLASNNCKKVKRSETIDRATQKIVTATAYVSGDWVKTYTVEALTAEEITAKADAATAAKEKAVRDQRDRLLAETDYLALSDNTLTAEMTTYRQALRDITDHANFPDLTEEDWPVKP